jgi:hypothetical protein
MESVLVLSAVSCCMMALDTGLLTCAILVLLLVLSLLRAYVDASRFFVVCVYFNCNTL